MKAVICVGIPASGKTEYARKLCKDGWVNINRDDIRFSITATSGWGEYKFSKAKENMVTAVQEAIVTEAAKTGKNVIISDTNLNPKTRKKWEDFLHPNFDVEIVDFPVTLEEAYRRDTLRPNGVGRGVIYTMYQKWLDYSGQKKYTPNPDLPDAVLVDVDGTLADMAGKRSPFEWDKVLGDEPRKHVIDMANAFEEQDYYIVVLSGRDGQCYEDTKDWLNHHGVMFDELHMRPEGNYEKDTAIKERIFWEKVVPKYNVVCAIDDRPCMIRKWRELGVETVCVSDPYIEF